jgi:hypothetical protein
VIENSPWSKETLEPYKPDSLKNPNMVHAQRAREKEKKTIIVTTEGGEVAYEGEEPKIGVKSTPNEILNTSSQSLADQQSDILKMSKEI